MKNRRGAETTLVIATTAMAAAQPFSIAIAQSALAIAALAWVAAGAPRASRALLLPAGLYAGWTLLSAAVSADPWAGLIDSKELCQFLILVVVPVLALDARRRLVFVLVGAAALSGLWGTIEYLLSSGGLLARADGPFGHYMTFAGILMLATLGAVSIGLTESRRWIGLVCLPTLAGGLAASYARNAWIGVTAGVLAVTVRSRPRWIPVVVFVLLVAGLALPEPMRLRLRSAFDPGANLDRLEMIDKGIELVRSHILFGVGPTQVQENLERLQTSRRLPAHLHNNGLQIAAERGVPALLAWLWLIVAIALASHRCSDPILANAAFGAVVALMTAGLFEYNFGDSEVKMAFLLLAGAAAPTPARPAPSAAG